jgi:hypothetical protein
MLKWKKPLLIRYAGFVKRTDAGFQVLTAAVMKSSKIWDELYGVIAQEIGLQD